MSKKFQIPSDTIEQLKKLKPQSVNIGHVNKGKNAPYGGFYCCVRGSGKALKTRTMSIPADVHEKVTFDKIVAIGEEFAERLAIPLNNEGYQAVLSRIVTTSSWNGEKIKTGQKPRTYSDSQEHPLMVLFGDIGRFKSAVRYVYKAKGYERIKDVLSVVSEEVEALNETARAERESAERATYEVAKALFKVHKETGFDMTIHAGNSAVKAVYLNLIREDKENKNGEKQNKLANSGNVYKLNGELWDGNGLPPTNFIKWLKENDKDDYEELRA